MRLRSALLCFQLIWLAAAGSESFDTILTTAAEEYDRRIVAATDALAATRQRIANEKVPLIAATREWEDKILALQTEVQSLEATQGQSTAMQGGITEETEALLRNLAYLATLARDSLDATEATLAPGENSMYASPIRQLQEQLGADDQTTLAPTIAEATTLVADRLERLIGGASATGASLQENDNRVRDGTFAFVGPETFFRAADGAFFGSVRQQNDSTFPITYAIPQWTKTRADSFFSGEPGTIAADATGGRALQLDRARGSWWDHVRKGGLVGLAILALGVLAALTGGLKLADLRRLAVDEPTTVGALFGHLEAGRKSQAESNAGSLRATTRELFQTGFRHWSKARDVLEDHLYAFVLRERIQHERRLPLLAVIAAAAPLLGLLGTVVGMVKTFTLITIVGTGNAAKLSSGISEALVTTELGLIVAIPTLVLHGYLAHRTQRKLSLLDRYAAEFVAVAEDVRTANQSDASTR